MFGNLSDVELKSIQTWEANGIRHIFQPSVYIPKPRRVAQLTIGKYTSDLDSLELKGTLDYDFASGVPTATREAIECGSIKIPDEDSYEDMMIGDKMYKGLIGKIFFWPTRANGTDY